MIIEVIAVSLSSIFLGSIWVAERIRTKKRKGLNIKEKVEKEEKSGPQILPYMSIIIGCLCPMCGVETTKYCGISYIPQACSNPEKCPAKKPHLHVECQSCKSKWFMAPRVKV